VIAVEKMPFHEALIAVRGNESASVVSSDWQLQLPVLASKNVTLRELRLSDAPSLLAMLNTEEVARFISPPPTTIEGFERFICWAHTERHAGRFVCFVVVPSGKDSAIGLFQVRPLESGFKTAEWGFCMGSPFWGTGVFVEAARMVLDFTFAEIGVHRLEARAAIRNGRGNGALRKLGASPEAILRGSFIRNGEILDQQLWSIIADNWALLRAPLPRVIH
jgi:RimJ/RimL family protein N-acetyltransferase